MRLLNEIRNYIGNYHVKSGVYHYYRNEFKPAVEFLRRALRGANVSREIEPFVGYTASILLGVVTYDANLLVIRRV